MDDMREPFDPRQYMSTISGNDYLEVKWRLLWLRDVHPDAVIRTEMVSDKLYNENFPDGKTVSVKEAVFKATIILPTGAEASGYGSETWGDFKDYREKAETKAIGRACAALGFGTQFSGGEYAGEAQAGRIVDSPVARRSGGSGIAIRQQPMGQGTTHEPVQGGTGRFPQQAAQGANFNPQSNLGQAQGQVQQRQQVNGQVLGDPNKAASANQIKYVSDLLRGMNVNPDAFDWDGLTNGEASGYISELKSGKLPADVAEALAAVNALQG